MTQPGPSRRARWVVGLSLVGLFTLITLGGMVVAVGQLVSGIGGLPADLSDPDDGWADSTATALVLDVDVYNLDDEKVSRFHDRENGDAGYAEVDIEFRNNGSAVDGDPISVTWMSWPDDLALPEPGEKIQIGYHAEDPENDPRLAGPDRAGSGAGSVLGPPAGAVDLAAGSAPVPGGPDPDDNERPHSVSAPVRWTIVISGTLAIVSLIGTLIWVRRAPAPDPVVRPAGWNQLGDQHSGWGQAVGPPPPGHPSSAQPPGWNPAAPAPVWNQALLTQPAVPPAPPTSDRPQAPPSGLTPPS